MTNLVIGLRGEVTSSNFDEWKQELVAQIQAVNTELTTDAQFARAETDIKRFKEAEATLKKAKQSAIDQAADIQNLFAAIDAVSEEVRQVRLSLGRQIKERKKEIKEECIQSGITTIRSYIGRQDENFQLVDHSDYLGRGAFDDAAKYKSNIKTLSTAIDATCFRIQTQIDRKAELVRRNALVMDSLPVDYQALFQDRGALLALAAGQLDEVIDQRIAVLNREQRPSEEEAPTERIDQETGEVLKGEEAAIGSETERRFVVEMELRATRADATFFLRDVEVTYEDSPIVRKIRLVDAS